MISKQFVVDQILKEKKSSSPQELGIGKAPINIALCKYWGKRNTELNLPNNSSFSISLPFYTETKIIPAKNLEIYLNGKLVNPESSFSKRLKEYTALFSDTKKTNYRIETTNDLPTAAGLATSASGYAACILALNNLYKWELSTQELSVLARLGSGSASRSIEKGFIQWNSGKCEDGMDSYAEKFPETWNQLRIGLVILEENEKAVSSREGMKRTVETSHFYQLWPEKCEQDIISLKNTILKKDFAEFGKIVESNALAMHATMLDSSPPFFYWSAKTIETVQKIWKLRQKGHNIFFTMDAGPNIKLLFQEKDIGLVAENFTTIEIVSPTFS